MQYLRTKMGKSYTDIDVKKAKQLTETWIVTEASKEFYFTTDKWRSNVVSAQIEDEGDEIIFTMPNNDFIKVE